MKYDNKFFTVIFVTFFAVVFSEVLVYFQLIFFWGEENHAMGYWLGFWTPLIDGLVAGILAMYLRGFYEKKLQLQSQRLKDFVEVSTDFVWEVDKNGVYTFASPGVKNILGYEPEEIIGKTPFDFMSEKEAARVSEVFQKTLEDFSAIKDFTNWNISKHGKKVLLLTNGVPIFENGTFIGYRGTDKDITESYVQENKYRQLLELASDGIHILDTDGNVIECSSTFAETLGYPMEEACKLNVRDWDVAIEHDVLAKMLNEFVKKPQLFQTKHKRRDGTVIDVQVNARGIDIDGEWYVYASQRDITQSVRQTNEIERSLRQYEAVLQTTQDGYWMVDTDNGKILEVNEAYCKMLGYTKDELIGMHIPQIDVNESAEEVARHIKKVKESGSDLFETRHMKKNGEIIDVEISVSFSPIDGGRFFILIRDITERKMGEKQMKLAHNVFASMTDGILVTDNSIKIIQVNERFCQNSGYSAHELIGKSPQFISSGWHDETFYKTMWSSLEHKDHWSGEIVDRKKDGEVYTCETTILVIRDEQDRITNYVAIQNDITEKKSHQELVNNLAYFDALTKLPNRLNFEENFNNRLSVAKRKKEKLAILFIDLDNFKTINDTYGHLVGDYFLREAAKRLKESIREEDTVGRLGGDEFAILIEDFKTPLDINAIATKIVNNFKEPFHVDEKVLYSGCSIGIAIYPEDGNNYITLMRSADTAMYTVKSKGKNGVAFFTTSMNEKITQQTLIENALRDALQNNELFLVYQPKVYCDHERVYGVEALLRWKHPELGFVYPDEFIPIAEGSGLIYPIGLWVIKQAVSDIECLNKEMNTVLKVSVNLSASQLQKSDFSQDFKKLIDTLNPSLTQLQLEITENQLMGKLDSVLPMLHEIQAMGVKFAIDDFGTGYSSLSYLKRLPVSTVKIDKSFVMDIDQNEEDKMIVSAIISLAHSLKKSVVAEGAEKKEHVELLKEMGCNSFQGYYYAKPMPISELKPFLLQRQ